MIVNKKYKILTPSGFQKFDGISRRIHKKHIKITMSEGKKFRCSLTHIIYSYENVGIEAQHYKAGDFVIDKYGKFSKILKIEILNKPFELFEMLEVKGGHKYIANNLIHHNCKFLGSGGSLIDSKGLNALSFSIPIETRDDDHFRIFSYPQEGHSYLLISDTGEGIGEDASTCQIIDITEEIWEQVAVYESNVISTNDFPGIIERIAILYNEALVIGENNFFPDILVDVIMDFEYENVFFDMEEDRHRYGIRTTKKSKKVGCSYLKRNIEEGRLILHDETTIFQLSVFVKKGSSYAADGEYHDDTISPLILLSYFMRRGDWVEEWCNVGIDIEGKRKALQAKLEEDIMPAGWVARGQGLEDLNSESRESGFRTGGNNGSFGYDSDYAENDISSLSDMY